MPASLTAPRTRLAVRLRTFATNRHESCGLDAFEQSEHAVAKVLKQAWLLGDLVAFDEQFRLRWTEGPFDGALSLNLGQEIVIRSFGWGLKDDHGILGIQEAGRLIAALPVLVRSVEGHLVCAG